MVSFYKPSQKKILSRNITVNIDSLDAFGQGIAIYQGKTIFVKHALPTEKVDVKLIEDKKNYAKGLIAKQHTVSQERVSPACQHYGVCGGCDMQHMPVAMQHMAKKNVLIHLLRKEVSSDISDQIVTVVSAGEYHYRRRARLAIKVDKNRLTIGFRKAESSQIVDIQVCPVLVSELEAILLPLKACINQLDNKHGLGHLDLIAVESGVIIVLRHITPLSQLDRERLCIFATTYGISFYLLGQALVTITEQKQHYYEVEQLRLAFNPLNFIQVNRDINIKMISQAVSWLNLTSQDHVLDLFCGMGNFSLPIAKIANRVVGVEGVAELVEKAKENVRLNQQYLNASTDFFEQNLDDFSSPPLWWSPDFNKVLLDPARAGAGNVIDNIIQLNPQRIVYISCNPATLARDSKKLFQIGYSIVNVSVLDMFPQTKHIESMLLFMKLG